MGSLAISPSILSRSLAASIFALASATLAQNAPEAFAVTSSHCEVAFHVRGSLSGFASRAPTVVSSESFTCTSRRARRCDLCDPTCDPLAISAAFASLAASLDRERTRVACLVFM